eukprot:581744-Pyramimonas_sp.AAC.1
MIATEGSEAGAEPPLSGRERERGGERREDCCSDCRVREGSVAAPQYPIGNRSLVRGRDPSLTSLKKEGSSYRAVLAVWPRGWWTR